MKQRVAIYVIDYGKSNSALEIMILTLNHRLRHRELTIDDIFHEKTTMPTQLHCMVHCDYSTKLNPDLQSQQTTMSSLVQQSSAFTQLIVDQFTSNCSWCLVRLQTNHGRKMRLQTAYKRRILDCTLEKKHGQLRWLWSFQNQDIRCGNCCTIPDVQLID